MTAPFLPPLDDSLPYPEQLVLCLPIYPALTDDGVDAVVGMIRKYR